jgi:beta-lactamase regulating signal transducer with metallopeptidase domain
MTIPDVIGGLDTFATPVGAAAVRGAVILLVALVATQLLRRRSAAARHAIWSGAIAAQLVVLALGLWGPHWRVATPPAVADAVAPVMAIPSADGARPVSSVHSDVPTFDVGVRRGTDTAASAAMLPVHAPAASPAPPLAGHAVLLLLWLAGALFVVLRLAAGTVMVAMLARRGARVDDGHWLSLAQKLANTLGIDRPLILMRGSAVAVPITWGIVYPIVLLPQDADGWTEERRRFVLVHEMAHVKRLDALTQLLGQIALALFWFDPLVWIANRRMQLEREHACDDYVLRHGTAPSQYAEELLEMVRSLGTPGHASAQPAFAALAMARRSEFEGRMLSILDPVLDRHPLSRRGTMIGVLASLLVVIPLAAVQPYRVDAHETPASTSTASADTDHLPESFKLSFHDVPAQQSAPQPASQSAVRPADSSAQLIAPFARAATALAAGRESLSRSMKKLATQVSTVQSCSSAQLGQTGSSTHVHSDSDDGMGVVSYLSTSDGRCAQASIVGKLTFNAGETDVTDMSSTAHALFRERTASDDRELTLYRADNGIVHAYRHNGSDTAYDDDARRWFARFLPSVLQEVSVNVGPRVAHWRAEGGVSRVLTEIGAMHSSSAKRMHYEALLDEGHLTTEDTDHIVEHAAHDLTSSSDLSAILQKAAPALRHLGGSARTLSAAIAAIPSSSDRTSVLRTYGGTDNKDVLLAVMRVAKTIPSSSDLSELLEELAPRYLNGTDAELRAAFFDAAGVIPSSTDLRAVLEVAIAYVSRSEAHARAVLESARRITSSSDKADVLVHFADAGGIRTPALRDQFMSVTSEMTSSTDMRRVLEAATKH